MKVGSRNARGQWLCARIPIAGERVKAAMEVKSKTCLKWSSLLLLNDAVCLRLSSAYVLVTLAPEQILDLDEKRERGGVG